MTLVTIGARDEYRLPTNVKPRHYDITVKTDLEALTFESFVRVDLDIKDPTIRIVMHSSGLDLRKASLYSYALESEQDLVQYDIDTTSERLAYTLPKSLPAGSKAMLKISFRGELGESIRGYYKSSYQKDGKTKYYALTQFAPTAARRAFPCWDEPLFKATYNVVLISRADTLNLNNMPAISEEIITSSHKPVGEPGYVALFSNLQDGEWKVTQFQTTPLMSTYIVEWANGHLEYMEDSVYLPISNKTIPLRMYATGEQVHQTQFSLELTKAVLPLYEKVFDIGYPLPKLDVLVATDFEAGAVESWGLIVGAPQVLLVDPKKADLRSKKMVARVLSHEIAHQWFGNITTMEWWTYLYLNEGFATLMGEVVITGKDAGQISKKTLYVFSDWKLGSNFITTHLNQALSLDAKPSSHPVEVDCPDSNHINQIFDNLSYSKAASVLRMLSSYVGQERFLKGVSVYLKNRLYGNSVTDDLWEGITKTTGVHVATIMDGWIKKIGFPVLSVTESPEGIFVRQDRFLETGKGQGADNETIWHVPLRILTADSDGKAITDNEIILTKQEQFFKLDTSKPYKLNADTTGVYRVLYEPKTLVKIAKEAAEDNSVFSLDDRMGLIYDIVALSSAGLAEVSSALTLVNILGKTEKEHLVWANVAENLTTLISTWWENERVIDQLNALRRALFSPLVEKLGYDNAAGDSSDTIMLRTLAITEAAAAHDSKVIKELQARFEHYLKTGDDSRIPADLQRVIYGTAVVNGGRAEYDAVVALHDKPKSPSARIAAIIAMCSTHDTDLLKETFEFIKTKSRDQDILQYFRGVSNNIKMRRTLITFFKIEYEMIMKRFGGSFSMPYLFSFSFSVLSSEKDLKETEAFFSDKDTSSYNLALNQSVDSIRARIQLLEMYDWAVSLDSASFAGLELKLEYIESSLSAGTLFTISRYQFTFGPPSNKCQKLFEFQSAAYVGDTTCLVEGIFAFRTWAIWNKKKGLVLALGAAFCAIWTGIVVVEVLHIRVTSYGPSPVPELIGCLTTNSNPSFLTAAYMLFTLNDAYESRNDLGASVSN
ncbi:Aminopeptidase 1 [Leucoagaricus sp. SymC.cos]|nr:Aminopeptidase 1 [Leucoagaricus sp. SymC.cos]